MLQGINGDYEHEYVVFSLNLDDIFDENFDHSHFQRETKIEPKSDHLIFLLQLGVILKHNPAQVNSARSILYCSLYSARNVP